MNNETASENGQLADAPEAKRRLAMSLDPLAAAAAVLAAPNAAVQPAPMDDGIAMAPLDAFVPRDPSDIGFGPNVEPIDMAPANPRPTQSKAERDAAEQKQVVEYRSFKRDIVKLPTQPTLEEARALLQKPENEGKQVRIRRSAWDVYLEHVESVGAPVIKAPVDADERTRDRYQMADFRRWFMLRNGASQGLSHSTMEALLRATTLEQFHAAVERDESVRPMNRYLKRKAGNQAAGLDRDLEKTRAVMLREAEQSGLLKAAHDFAFREGEIPEELRRGGVVSVEQARKLAKQHNVFVEEKPILSEEQDPDARARYKQEDAQNAIRYINQGMPVHMPVPRGEGDASDAGTMPTVRMAEDGVDAHDAEAVRAHMESMAEPLARVLRDYERYRDRQTRPDGVKTRFSSVDPKKFSNEQMRASNGRLERFDECSLFDMLRMKTLIESQMEANHYTMCHSDMLELPVFTSRMVMLMMPQQPFPRATNASLCYMILMAALTIVCQSDVLPPNVVAQAELKKKLDVLVAMGGRRTPSMIGKSRQNKLKGLASMEDMRSFFEKRREEVDDTVNRQIGHLIAWWQNNDTRWTANQTLVRTHNLAKTDYDALRAQDDEDARHIFYRKLYGILQRHTVETLNTMEQALTLGLGRYVVRSMMPALITRPLDPTPDIVLDQFVKSGFKFQDAMRKQRRAHVEHYADMIDERLVPPLPITADGRDIPIDQAREWTPTYEDLQLALRFKLLKMDERFQSDVTNRFLGEQARRKREAVEKLKREAAKAEAAGTLLQEHDIANPGAVPRKAIDELHERQQRVACQQEQAAATAAANASMPPTTEQ